jgi:hypothetical protein
VVFTNFSDLYSPGVFLCFISFVGTKEMKINACKAILLDSKKIDTTFDFIFFREIINE